MGIDVLVVPGATRLLFSFFIWFLFAFGWFFRLVCRFDGLNWLVDWLVGGLVDVSSLVS